MRRMGTLRSPLLRGAIAAAASAAALAVAGPGLAASAGAPCTSKDIAVRFSAIPGSAGAGSISYALQVKKTTGNVCSVTGLPRLQLLDAKGKALPTAQAPAHPGMATAVLVYLERGQSAWAEVRFSPDVPGTGEPVSGRQCEPTAARIRATVGVASATATGPIVPATPVCSQGRLLVGPLSPAKPTA